MFQPKNMLQWGGWRMLRPSLVMWSLLAPGLTHPITAERSWRSHFSFLALSFLSNKIERLDWINWKFPFQLKHSVIPSVTLNWPPRNIIYVTGSPLRAWLMKWSDSHWTQKASSKIKSSVWEHCWFKSPEALNLLSSPVMAQILACLWQSRRHGPLRPPGQESGVKNRPFQECRTERDSHPHTTRSTCPGEREKSQVAQQRYL